MEAVAAPQSAIEGGCLDTAVAVNLSERTPAASTVGDQTSWDSVLSTYAKENFMRFWKPRLALASSAAAGLALAAALVVPRAVIDVLLMIIRRQTPSTEPVSGNQPSARDRAFARTRSRNSRSWITSPNAHVTTAEVITLLGDGSLPENGAVLID